MEDIIGHPNHYCEGRKADNSALQDLLKARQYLDFEIAALQEELNA